MSFVLYRGGEPTSDADAVALGDRVRHVQRNGVRCRRSRRPCARAVIASEDASSVRHTSGIDWDLDVAAITGGPAGGARRRGGGSTITMQVAKNMFLWLGPQLRPQGASNFRSASGSILVLPKPRIMELYLNVAEWGPRTGFRARGRGPLCLQQVRRPSCPAAKAALLAAILPNPVTRSANRRHGPWRYAGIAGTVAARAVIADFELPAGAKATP